MRSAARELVERAHRRRRPGGGGGQRAACLAVGRPLHRSSATASTTWSARGGAGAAAGSRHRPRHPPPRRGRLVRRHAVPAGRARGGDAKRLRPLVLAKSSTKSTVYRPSYLDYVAVRTFGPRRRGRPASTGSSACTRSPPTPSRSPASRCCAASSTWCSRPAGLPADSHDGKALIEILEGYPREELFEISVAAADPDRAGRARPRRAQAGPPVPPPRRLRPVRVLPGVPAKGPVHHAGQAARCQEILRRALGGVSVDYSAMVGNSALARLHVVVHGEPGRPLATADQAALQARDRGRGPLLGRGPDRGGRAPARRRSRRHRGERAAPSAIPADRTRPTPGPPRRWRTSRRCSGCKRMSAPVRAPPFHQSERSVATPGLPPFPDHAVGRAAAVAAHGA